MLLYCGWTEVAGIADRGSFDLTAHSKASGQDLTAFVRYEEPVERLQYSARAVMKHVPQELKRQCQEIRRAVEEAPQEEYERLSREMAEGDTVTIGGFRLPKDCIALKKDAVKVHGESVAPIAIEPSFGVGRLVYAVLEHSFYCRESDPERTVFRFGPQVAPSKVAVVTLLNKPELERVASGLVAQMRLANISCKGDYSGVQIGKKYARLDEIGIPYVITVDVDSLEDGKATLRERDSMCQARLEVPLLVDVVGKLVRGAMRFDEL